MATHLIILLVIIVIVRRKVKITIESLQGEGGRSPFAGRSLLRCNAWAPNTGRPDTLAAAAAVL